MNTDCVNCFFIGTAAGYILAVGVVLLARKIANDLRERVTEGLHTYLEAESAKRGNSESDKGSK